MKDLLPTYGLKYPTLDSLAHDGMRLEHIEGLSLITVDFYQRPTFGNGNGPISGVQSVCQWGPKLSYLDEAVAKLFAGEKICLPLPRLESHSSESTGELLLPPVQL